MTRRIWKLLAASNSSCNRKRYMVNNIRQSEWYIGKQVNKIKVCLTGCNRRLWNVSLIELNSNIYISVTRLGWGNGFFLLEGPAKHSFYAAQVCGKASPIVARRTSSSDPAWDFQHGQVQLHHFAFSVVRMLECFLSCSVEIHQTASNFWLSFSPHLTRTLGSSSSDQHHQKPTSFETSANWGWTFSFLPSSLHDNWHAWRLVFHLPSVLQ